MQAIKVTLFVVAIFVTLILIYSNLYMPKYANSLFFGAVVMWTVWWLVSFQFLTGDKPGLLTSKNETVLLKGQAEQIQAHGSVISAEAAVERAHGDLATAKTNRRTNELQLQEVEATFTRKQLMEEALQKNHLLITNLATEKKVPVSDYTAYLMKTMEAQVQYETAALIAKTDLEKERMSIEQTLRLALMESSIKFEDRLSIIDKIAKVKKRLKRTTDADVKQLLKEELDTLQAQLDASRQTDIPKSNRAQA